MNALAPAPDFGLIANLADSDDTLALRTALTSGQHYANIGAAGTAMRFLTAYLAMQPGEWILTGSERMKERPIRLLVDTLNSLGAHIGYVEDAGFPPLRITGRALEGGEASISGGVSSQYISALLMTAPAMRQGLRLRLKGQIVSRPYISLTTELMRHHGVNVLSESPGEFIIEPQTYTPMPLTVEADWSAASYWYAIASLADEATIRLDGLFRDSLQGDAAVAGLYKQLGVQTEYADNCVIISRCGEPAASIEYDFTDEPDLAQTLVANCCFLGVHFRFGGLQSLRIKETDRLSALRTELGKLGYDLRLGGSSLEWSGQTCTPNPAPLIDTYNDHRMAMSFAPAAFIRPEGIEIAEAEVVSKSYPRFWSDLSQAGFGID
jgi:3-phosphoshikimate 1-carboxyvinyltransferase